MRACETQLSALHNVYNKHVFYSLHWHQC